MKIRDIDPLELLKRNNAFYQSPVDKDGNFLGPIVAYAGTYLDEKGVPKNYVGDTYFNIAQVEPYLELRDYFVELIFQDFLKRNFSEFDKVVGMAMGGIIFSVAFGSAVKVPTIFAEKIITELDNPEAGTREKSKLDITRHQILPEEQVIIFEDICNNFSTTQKAIDLIASKGGKVVAIACVVNRSNSQMWNGLPVFSAVWKPSPQYQQDDPKVAALITAGKIIWKAKNFWQELEKHEEK